MVQMSKCTSCIRWTAFSLDVLISIGGSALLGLSVWVHTEDNEYKHIANNTIVSASIIALSVLVFITGLFGLCAILLLNPKLLKFYFAMITILFLIEVSGAIYLYLQQDKLKDFIQGNWSEIDDKTRILIQEKLKCCSMNPVITSHESSNHSSCYESVDGVDNRRKDCYNELIDWVKRNVVMLATCCVVIAIIQIFLLASSCRLLSSIESGDRMVKQVTVRPMDSGKPNKKFSSNGNIDPDDLFTYKSNSLDKKVERRQWAKVEDRDQSRKSILTRIERSTR